MENSSVHQTRMAEHAFAPQEAEQESGGKTVAPPPFQLMASDVAAPTPPSETPQNNTGLPDDLKMGMEAMSGMSMDDVKVHRNSAEPDKMGAHAFAQGSDIHVASGQDHHLPHEAWHVVQQKQGRVQATTKIGGKAVNDDASLENEADAMGAKALQMKVDTAAKPLSPVAAGGENAPLQGKFTGAPVAQLATNKTQGNITYVTEDFQHGLEKKKRERTSRVVLQGKNKKNSDGANEPISMYNADTGKFDDMEGLHKGHVAAAKFGGWNASYNIVPMIANFNTGPYAAVERKIGEELEADNTVTITPRYQGFFDGRLPVSFVVESSGGFKTEVDHKVPPRVATSDELNDQFEKTAADTDSRDHALSILAEAAKRNMIPSNYLGSPYLKLDIEWLNGGGHGNPMPFKAFGSWQVDQILSYNIRLHGGMMESDAWGVEGSAEPYENLRENGRGDRPEVDHIIPNSRGGSNFFTNARVVSWELNNKLERVKNPSEKKMKW